jgi:hypothetical protein
MSQTGTKPVLLTVPSTAVLKSFVSWSAPLHISHPANSQLRLIHSLLPTVLPWTSASIPP